MIRAIIVHSAKEAVVPWWSKVEGLQKVTRIDFQPGLNILWARNGAGKSTVLKTMARLLHCEQGGRSVVTEESLREFFPFGLSDGKKTREKGAFGITVEHDGKPALFVDPGRKLGIIGGAFDDDFFMEGVQSVMSKGSSGQEVTFRLNDTFKTAFEGTVPTKWDFRISKAHVNDSWKARIERVEESLKATIDPGPPTILFDEPDRSLDVDNQVILWGTLVKLAERAQVIVASHNVAALFAPNAHYIELSPGYLDQCRRLFASINLKETWQDPIAFALSKATAAAPPKPEAPPAPAPPAAKRHRPKYKVKT